MPQTVPSETYQQAHRGAALTDRHERGWIVVSGADRRAYLHGLLTNDIAALAAGTGCYSAYLTPQGRMIADLWLYELGDVLLVSMAAEVKDQVLAKFDQFIFTEDVQLGDVSSSFQSVAVVGTRSASIIGPLLSIDVAGLDALPLHGNLRATFDHQPAIVLRTSDLGVPGFDLLVDAASGDQLRQLILDAGAVPLDAETRATLRVEAGVPMFHQDMDETTIPLEAGIEARAISMTKGCYVGQEVIVRVLHRGHGRVAKKLVGLTLPPDAHAERGTEVRVEDRVIGALTSVAWSPALQRPIALGYVQRDFVAPGTRVSVAGYDAEVAALPFVPVNS